MDVENMTSSVSRDKTGNWVATVKMKAGQDAAAVSVKTYRVGFEKDLAEAASLCSEALAAQIRLRASLAALA